MKQIVKNADGDGELTYNSMAEVKTLYEQGFISPDDLIRPEDSQRWVKAGTLRALAGAESRSTRETAMGLRIALAVAISLAVAGAVHGNRTVLFLGLVAAGVMTPFFVYRRKR